MQNLLSTLAAVVVVLSVAVAGIVAPVLPVLSVGLLACAALSVRLLVLRGA